MTKETYLKPEITSETLEPGTLLVAGSPVDGNGGPPPGPSPNILGLALFCCDFPSMVVIC